ncbi:MAG: D-glycerate dehydrogenase [Cellvibrionales bacterium]|jgi:glyoxylate reductase
MSLDRSSVVVALPLPDEVLEALAPHCELSVCSGTGPMPAEELADRAASADAILCSLGNTIDEALIAACPRLRTVSSISVGVDHIDMAAADRARLPIGHTPGVLVDSTADLALALMLAVTRRVAEADRFIRSGGWSAGWSTGFFLGSDLSRATVGIVGLGPIGCAVARRVQAFGARVIGWNRTLREVSGVKSVELDALFSEADIVSLHTAATPETHHLVNASRLARMKSGAVLVNTSRGAVVDEVALIAALQAQHIAAGLDVYAVEPLPPDSPLLQLDNAVLLPHLGSATAATRQAMIERAVANLLAGLRGERVPWCVNPRVYDPI